VNFAELRAGHLRLRRVVVARRGSAQRNVVFTEAADN
jgi:hypothetical protein